MADWWESAPLAQPTTAPIPKGGANWWDAAPLAQPAPAEPADTRPDRGILDATARGAAQGFTANFSDEMRGLVEAGGANPDDPASLAKLLKGALSYWSGDKDAKKRYEETVARERQLNKTAEDQHGLASTVGAIGGALALPIGVGAQAATLPGRMVAGAATGAALGGAAGVGSGEGAADSLTRGAIGAAGGGVLGAAAPAVIEGAIQGGRAIATPVANAIRGIRDPEGEAARRVAVALERDAQVDPGATSRLTPAEFAASNQSGGPAMVQDLGGETTRALARSAANTSPEGRGILNRAIDDRFEGQTPRVVDWFNTSFNYPNADDAAEAIQKVAKTVNRGNYERVMSAHPVVNVPAEITERPVVAQAMKDAVSLAKNHGEKLEGPPELRTILSGDGYHIADDVQNPAQTSLRYWDYVKKSIDSRIEKAKRSGGVEDLNSKEKADFGGLVDAKNALVAHLDTAAPGYKDARAGAAAFFGAENALEAGQNIVSSKLSNREVARGLSKMSPEERKLAQDGFVDRYIQTLQEVGDRRSIVNKIGDSPAARERLNMVLGPQKATELEAKLRVEGIMDMARGAVQGNSTTARQLAELGLAGGAGALGNGLDFNTVHPSALMTAALVYGAAKGRGRINENVARRVADLLTSRDPDVVSRGMRMVANNQTLLSSLRSADKGLARVGSSEAPSLPFIPAISPSRADNQPDAKRPPGQ
jgi:hypothetical protein